MIQIIPTILEKSFSQIAEKLHQIEAQAPKINWVHLDVMDGKFVPNTTWSNSSDLATIQTGLKLEVHLMVQDPFSVINPWLNQNNIKRIIIHKEAVDANQLAEIIKIIKLANKEVGIAISPGTDINTIKNYLDKIDCVLIMSVEPGLGGQKFQTPSINKVKDLRNKDHNIKIAVDGGINNQNAKTLVQAGANCLCVGSFLWKGLGVD